MQDPGHEFPESRSKQFVTMCSIGEADFGDEGAVHSMPVSAKVDDTMDTSEICKKCNSESVVLKLPAKDPQCKSCFLDYVHHKFRASLGSTKILPRDANVLLVVNGSANSIVLLDMCRFAQQLDRYRRLRFTPKILFVDEQPLVDQQTSQRVIKIIKSYSFEAFYQPLGSSDAPLPITDQLDLNAFTEQRTNFMETFNCLQSLTSKQDFLLQLRKKIWRSAARHLDCGIVFVPETNADLAKALLTDISLGRGAAAAQDVAFVDDRVTDVKLVRPIRDLNDLEVGHYLQLNNLEFIPELSLFGEDAPSGASIQNLTSEFVKNLQKNYSATITTVFRTGDKMANKGNDTGERCRICHGHVDMGNSETLYATRLSGYLSTHQFTGEINADHLDAAVDKPAADLCHACLSMSRDTSGAKDFIFAFNDD